VSDERVAHVAPLYSFKSVEQFKADIEFLGKHYDCAPLSVILDAIKGGAPIPSGSFHLTFDDGFSEIATVIAPLLREKGIPATFFLNTAFLDNRELCYQHEASLLWNLFEAEPDSFRPVQELLDAHFGRKTAPNDVLKVRFAERHILKTISAAANLDTAAYLKRRQPYLTSEQVRALLAQGFSIGSHSVNHPLYREIPLAEQLWQTKESITDLRDRFQLSYSVFAFPHSARGVTDDFFRCAQAFLDLTFGTAGMTKHFWPTHLERFSFEKPVRPARELLTREFVRACWRNRIAPARSLASK
jgi:peptidoglycan/xylan/chitin deacetylase (PgdA/CDA1 family)